MATRKSKLRLELARDRDSKGRPFVLEYDPVEGILWARPKGSQERHAISVRGAWEHAATQAAGIRPGAKMLGMSRRDL